MSGCVYAITNSQNCKKYIGRTFAPVEFRFQKHLEKLRAGTHSNKPLLSDYQKYGEAAFSVSVIEVIPGRHDDNRREVFWMKRLKTYDERLGYNSVDNEMRKVRREHGMYVPNRAR